MFIWAAIAVVAAAFGVSVVSSLSKRPGGLLELGTVSNQWLAEHRQHQESDRSR
jgi:hypothetical protein